MSVQVPIDTTVIVPCYNEATRLEVARFHAFVASGPPVRFRFVDDGSTDGTKDVLAELCAAYPARLDCMSLACNGGKAEAVRAGVIHTLDADTANGPPAYFGYWDADLATGLEEVLLFRRVLIERDEVVGVLGSRVRLLGREIERRPMRHYLGRVFSTVASLVLALPVYDTQCGAKLFRRSAATTVAFDEPFLSRWAFDVEIIARLRAALGAHALTKRLVEQPLDAWRDVAGSNLRMRHILGMGIDLLRIAERYPRRR